MIFTSVDLTAKLVELPNYLRKVLLVFYDNTC